MKRYVRIVGLKSDEVERYKEIHTAVWPSVLKTVYDCNIRNYSIYLHQMPDGKHYVFAYLEYVGDDYDADMRRMAADPATQEWWTITDPMQEPLPNRPEGEWWSLLEEVFHID